MAVQPDKRAREVQQIEAGLNLTERFRVGEYTLQAAARTLQPVTYEIRRDRPGFEDGHSVYRDLHDGWVVHDDEVRHATREGPLACLEWFAARQTS